MFGPKVNIDSNFYCHLTLTPIQASISKWDRVQVYWQGR